MSYTGGPTMLSKALSFAAGVLYNEQNMKEARKRHKLMPTPRHDRLQVNELWFGTCSRFCVFAATVAQMTIPTRRQIISMRNCRSRFFFLAFSSPSRSSEWFPKVSIRKSSCPWPALMDLFLWWRKRKAWAFGSGDSRFPRSHSKAHSRHLEAVGGKLQHFLREK